MFIWDLDETLIILYTLLTGSFAQRNNKASAECLIDRREARAARR